MLQIVKSQVQGLKPFYLLYLCCKQIESAKKTVPNLALPLQKKPRSALL